MSPKGINRNKLHKLFTFIWRIKIKHKIDVCGEVTWPSKLHMCIITYLDILSTEPAVKRPRHSYIRGLGETDAILMCSFLGDVRTPNCSKNSLLIYPTTSMYTKSYHYLQRNPAYNTGETTCLLYWTTGAAMQWSPHLRGTRNVNSHNPPNNDYFHIFLQENIFRESNLCQDHLIAPHSI